MMTLLVWNTPFKLSRADFIFYYKYIIHPSYHESKLCSLLCQLQPPKTKCSLKICTHYNSFSTFNICSNVITWTQQYTHIFSYPINTCSSMCRYMHRLIANSSFSSDSYMRMWEPPRLDENTGGSTGISWNIVVTPHVQWSFVIIHLATVHRSFQDCPATVTMSVFTQFCNIWMDAATSKLCNCAVSQSSANIWHNIICLFSCCHRMSSSDMLCQTSMHQHHYRPVPCISVTGPLDHALASPGPWTMHLHHNGPGPCIAIIMALDHALA